MSQWIKEGGLIVPESATLAKRMQAEMQKKTENGRFFSTSAMTQGTSLGYTKPAETFPFEVLRQARNKSLIDKIIINARITQMKHIAKRVIVPGKQTGYRVVHKNYADPNYKPTKDVIQRCKETEEIIGNVNRNIHPGGFRDFSSISVDQELTYDRKVMIITRDRTGLPITFHLVDGTTVRPKELLIQQYMRDEKIDNREQATETYYDQFGIDLSSAAYVQVVDGQPVASWTKDEINVNITNPSVEINKWAYGAGSLLEQSIQATDTWLDAWAYNEGLFNQDSPESLLFLYGDVDPIGLGAFQRQILDQNGSGDYQKIPVIPASADENMRAELVKIRELPKDIQFAEFLRMIVQLKTAAYRAHPSLVNFSIDKGGSGGLNIGNNNEDALVQQAHEEGFQSIVHGQADWLTETIIKPRYDDLVMIYEVDTENESQRIELINKQTESTMTFNEGRRAQGLKGDLPFGDIPNNANYINGMQAQLQMQGTNQDSKQETEQPVQKNLQKNDEKVLVLEFD